MQTRDAIASDARAISSERLEQEIRVLRERLAFYEGFDRLIQDNVAHARELFRLAAQERETASAESQRVRQETAQREAELRAELEAIAVEVGSLAAAAGALAERVARALGERGNLDGGLRPVGPDGALAVVMVVHGVPSAADAMALQRFVTSLPHVASVTAREFAGGVLRLDVRAYDRLRIDHLRNWEPSRRIEPLTERADVVEFALAADSA